MVRFLLVVCLFWPQLSQAQLLFNNPFQEGSYVLADSRTVRHAGELTLQQNGATLVVKSLHGKNLKLGPEQVASFRIGNQHYVPAGNFHVMGGLGGADIEDIFAEQLDSGQVQLLRYDYAIQNAGSMGAGGMMMGGGSWNLSAFLLRAAGQSAYTAVQSGAYSNAGKRFREAVQPFFAARPDLVKLLDEKRIDATNLPAAIYALNRNQPFNPAGTSPH